MIALLVGHSRPGDSGAVSVEGVSEHKFNSVLARHTKGVLDTMCIKSVVIDRYEGSGYAAAMTWLAAHLKSIGATAAIEFHFNSATPTAKGFEYLYWHSSSRGKALARFLASSHASFRPASTPRQDKGILGIKSAAERGGQFLQKTHCPAVILEPFFGSNAAEWKDASANVAGYAGMIASGISKWL